MRDELNLLKDDTFDLLKEVEQELGIDAAKRLVGAYGGQLVSTPRHASGSALERVLGSKLAEFLVELRGGENLAVPIGQKYKKTRVRDGVIAHPELSANELARKYGVTYTRILQVRRELRAQGFPNTRGKSRVGITRNGVIAHPELSNRELAVKFGVQEKQIERIRRELQKFGTENPTDREVLPS